MWTVKKQNWTVKKIKLSQYVSMPIAVASQCRELVTKLKVKTGLWKN